MPGFLDDIFELEHPIDVMYLMHKVYMRHSEEVESLSKSSEKDSDLDILATQLSEWLDHIYYHTDTEDLYMTGPLKDKELHDGRMPLKENVLEHDVIRDSGKIASDSISNIATVSPVSYFSIKELLSMEEENHEILMTRVESVEEELKKILGNTKLDGAFRRHLYEQIVALKVAEYGSDCLRINPGNIGKEDRVREVVASAKDNGIPIRVGVNAGSLEKDLQKKYTEPTPEAMVESAFRHIDILNRLNFDDFKVSLKASEVFMTVFAYRQLASQIDNPLHLGITEAGSFRSGTVKSSIGMGMLLSEGIGDTIRVSLASDPVNEVKVGFDILKSLHLRKKGVNLIACPSCSRQKFDVISVVNELESRLEDITESIDVAVIGCVVNGPGEAKEVSVGLTGGSPNLLYIDGKTHSKVDNESLVDTLEMQIRRRIPISNV